jgi:Cyclin
MASVDPVAMNSVSALGVLLNHLVELDEARAVAKYGGEGRSSPCRIFQCLTAPSVSIDEYLNRLNKYFNCSDAVWVVGLIYLDRVIKMSGLVVTILNVHRLILTALAVAAKFVDDVYYSNLFYGKVGGIKAKEMNSLESEFLTLLGWKLNVSTEDFYHYRDKVLWTVLPQTPSTSPGSPPYSIEEDEHSCFP